VTEFALNSNQNAPASIISGGTNSLWFLEGLNSQVGRIGTITTAGQVTEFPGQVGQTGSAGIAFGPDGNLWVTDAYGNQIDRINPQTGAVTGQYSVPTAGSFPSGMTLGPNQNLYFAEQYGGQIGAFNPSNPTAFTEIPIPTAGARPDQMVTGHDGNVWFTDFGNPAIGVVELSGQGPSPTGTDLGGGGNPGNSSIHPTIVGAAPLYQTVNVGKPHKGHVKTRRTFVGFELTFSEGLAAARAEDAANYSVLVKSRHGRKTVTKPAGFRVSYNPSKFAVDLLLTRKQTFSKGGVLTVNGTSNNGITDLAGDSLVGNSVFTIGPKARSVTP
jgi:hypothetical protein